MIFFKYKNKVMAKNFIISTSFLTCCFIQSKKYFSSILLITTLWSCSPKELINAQPSNTPTIIDKVVGGRCEGCELYDVEMPKNLHWQTTINPADEKGEILTIEGYIYQQDGKTPAANVVVYLYHTNNAGYYAPSTTQQGARRHGHLRGWIKSRADGYYIFSTIKPAPYPNAAIPAHIHPTIKETGKTSYYIDDYVFENEAFVTADYVKNQELRCGSGIIQLTKDSNGVWHGKRNLILGLNIPNY
jgi:protocatechuate 3,4-dioxygenase, beta subunit